jgi:DNA-binding XRE family transcriptional regulator
MTDNGDGPMSRAQVDLVIRVRHLIKTGEAKKMRVRAGLSQHELADLAGATQSNIQRWEQGSRPEWHLALRYAQALLWLEGILDDLEKP